MKFGQTMITGYRRLVANHHRLLPIVTRLTAPESSKLVYLLAKARTGDEMLLSALAVQLVDHRSELGPHEIVRAVYGLSKLNYIQDEGKTIGLLASEARRNLDVYSLDDCAQLVSSLARCKVKNPALLTRVIARISPDSVMDCSSQSLVNLMTAFARSGVTTSRKQNVWPILADELSLRLRTVPDSLSLTDGIGAILAYSYPNVGHAHTALFESVSDLVSSHSSILPLEQVLKYVKACSRAQFRHMRALHACANSLRGNSELVSTLSNTDFLSLVTALNKLGAEMVELSDEAARRGMTAVSAQPLEGVWFKQKSVHEEATEGKKSRRELRAVKRQIWTGKSQNRSN